MELNEIYSKVLTTLYEAFFKGEEACRLHEIQRAEGWDEKEFAKIVDRLKYDNLIKPFTIDGLYKITFLGILKVENEIQEPVDIIKENEIFRTELLELLAKKYDEHGPRSTLSYHDLKNKYDRNLLDTNLNVLSDLDYIQYTNASSFTISYEGLEALKEWKEMPVMNKPLVFISYGTAELDLADFVKRILLRVSDNKMEVFVAKRDISSGADPLKTMLDEKLKQADAIIPICSYKSKETPWLWWESASVWAINGKVHPLFTNISPNEFGGPLVLVVQGKEFFVKQEFFETVETLCRNLNITPTQLDFNEEEEVIYSQLADAGLKPFHVAHVKIGYNILEQKQDFHQYSLKFEIQNKSDTAFNDIVLDLFFPTKYLAKKKWDYSHLTSTEEGEYTCLTFIFNNLRENALKKYSPFLLPEKILKIFGTEEGGITNLIYEMDNDRYEDKDKYKVSYNLYINGRVPQKDSVEFSSLQFF